MINENIDPNSIPSGCRPHAQKIMDMANEHISTLKNHVDHLKNMYSNSESKVSAWKGLHKQSEAHAAVLHNTINDFLEGRPGAKTTMKKVFDASFGKGQTTSDGERMSALNYLGYIRDKFQQRTRRDRSKGKVIDASVASAIETELPTEDALPISRAKRIPRLNITNESINYFKSRSKKFLISISTS